MTAGTSRMLVALAAIATGAALHATGEPATLPVVQDGAIDLSGAWKIAIGKPAPDSDGKDLPAINFPETIQLPGTTETRGLGAGNPKSDTGRLTRIRYFEGPAWYRREVEIPPAWAGRKISLYLERTKYTCVWLDGKPCGSNTLCCSAQIYDLSAFAAPGRHVLTILVDNRRSRHPILGGHQFSDDTQGNWNGILGRIELRSAGVIRIDDVQVYPGAGRRSVRVKVSVENDTGKPVSGVIGLSAESLNEPTGTPRHVPTPVHSDCTASSGASTVELPWDLGAQAHLWDEFSPVLYRLTVNFSASGESSSRQVVFGLREFAHKDGQFTINGRPTFLRGKHDACVFPLTGHPPMDADGWLKYLGVCKEYGVNHIRCHTWIPPDAAFEAADRLGMYLQPELPFWGGFNSWAAAALLPEAACALRQYGNHPSFVMMSLGNELGGDRSAMAEMVRELRAIDSRHLYAQGSNNFFSKPQLNEGDDFWSSVRIRTADGLHNARASFATVDRADGTVQIGPASTRNDFSKANRGIPIPVVGHETGQYTVYPDFSEIAKYTGVSRARNLEGFGRNLEERGMLDQADAFFKASGALAAICYREEIESALRTPGWGGFQILDLQDFPGQGTALVGILNSFMESKGFVAPEEWRQSCAPVVVLARFDKYTWEEGETFGADIDLAHYGPADFDAVEAGWQIGTSEGSAIASGTLAPVSAKQGNVRRLGAVGLTIPKGRYPGRFDFRILVKAGGCTYQNSYPLWIYPSRHETEPPAGVTVARTYDEQTRRVLAGGGRVLIIAADGSITNTVGGGFATDFWCWPMFHNKPGTMGLLCDPAHPALAGFPTETHSNWQWFNLAVGSAPVILDGVPSGCRPIVQVIDNLGRNHRLGLVFETRVGAGRLLVCACDLMKLADKPEARQLKDSLISYAGSEKFDPKDEIPVELLDKALASEQAGGQVALRQTN
jgi:hypothetical protein